MSEIFDLVVRGTRVLQGKKFLPLEIGVRNGSIATLAPLGAGLRAEQVIDASAFSVVPGFIDPHVHFDNPGDSITEDFRIGTANAALGGITCVIDHPFSTPLTVTATAVQQKVASAGSSAATDFGVWGGLTEEHLNEIPKMQSLGVNGFKAFLPENDMGVTAARDTHLAAGFQLTRNAGGMILVHAEHRESLLEIERHCRELGQIDYASFARHRDTEVELRAVREVLEIAERTSGAVHFVHLSVPEAVDLVTAARDRGVQASCEVAAHHLLLTDHDLVAQGWPALCAPPLRSAESVEGLWQRLEAGDIAAVVSDHCPYSAEEKSAADQDSFAGPFGIQGIREFAPLFLHEAVQRGWDLADALAYLTNRPAELFSLADRKGSIREGNDADLVFLDIETPCQIDPSGQIGPWKWTPYAGRTSQISVHSVFLRGQATVVAHELQDVAGIGEFIEMRSSA